MMTREIAPVLDCDDYDDIGKSMMCELFFANFWVIIMCPVFVHSNLKT